MGAPPAHPLLTDGDWVREQRRLGRMYEDMAEELGCSVPTIARWVKRHQAPRPIRSILYPQLADRDWLVAQRAARRTVPAMAEELGCCEATVDHWISVHGLTRQSPRVAVRDGRVVLLKRCDECGLDGICLDGAESDFRVHSRLRDGKPSYGRLCRICDAAASRARRARRRDQINAAQRLRHAERMKNDPEYRKRRRRASREAARRYLAKPEVAEAARKRSIEYHRERRRRDREGVNEENRMYYALRKQRNGEEVRRKRPTVIDGTLPTVPAEPFRRWLVEYDRLGGFDGNSEALAAALGIGIRRVGAIMRGEYKNVAVDVVSRALTDAYLTPCLDGQVIVTLDDLYPDEEELAA